MLATSPPRFARGVGLTSTGRGRPNTVARRGGWGVVQLWSLGMEMVMAAGRLRMAMALLCLCFFDCHWETGQEEEERG